MASAREVTALPPNVQALLRQANRVMPQVHKTAAVARKIEASTELRKKTRMVRKLAPIAFSRLRQAPICSQRKRVLKRGQDSRRRLDRGPAHRQARWDVAL